MKQEFTLLKRFLAPTPKSVKMLIVGCVITVLNILWGRLLLYWNNLKPDRWDNWLFMFGCLLIGFVVGLGFTVDEEALKKKSVLDNIKKRVDNRK